jgi:hypothetical protein
LLASIGYAKLINGTPEDPSGMLPEKISEDREEVELDKAAKDSPTECLVDEKSSVSESTNPSRQGLQ